MPGYVEINIWTPQMDSAEELEAFIKVFIAPYLEKIEAKMTTDSGYTVVDMNDPEVVSD